jgi:uncharacterized protein
VDYFEQRGIPFVVAVNCFFGEALHTVDAVREALVVGGDVPVLLSDARRRESSKAVLIEVVQQAVMRASGALRGTATTR